VSTFFGVLLAIVAAGLLFFATVAFALYGNCFNDNCGPLPPRAFWPAVRSGSPFGLAAVVVMAVACHLFMRGRPSVTPSVVRASLLAVLSSAAFVAVLWVVAEQAAKGAAAVVIVGGPAAALLWLIGTIAVARRAARARVDNRL
jgi:hypothetical protein